MPRFPARWDLEKKEAISQHNGYYEKRREGGEGKRKDKRETTKVAANAKHGARRKEGPRTAYWPWRGKKREETPRSLTIAEGERRRDAAALKGCNSNSKEGVNENFVGMFSQLKGDIEKALFSGRG